MIRRHSQLARPLRPTQRCWKNRCWCWTKQQSFRARSSHRGQAPPSAQTCICAAGKRGSSFGATKRSTAESADVLSFRGNTEVIPLGYEASFIAAFTQDFERRLRVCRAQVFSCAVAQKFSRTAMPTPRILTACGEQCTLPYYGSNLTDAIFLPRAWPRAARRTATTRRRAARGGRATCAPA